MKVNKERVEKKFQLLLNVLQERFEETNDQWFLDRFDNVLSDKIEFTETGMINEMSMSFLNGLWKRYSTPNICVFTVHFSKDKVIKELLDKKKVPYRGYESGFMYFVYVPFSEKDFVLDSIDVLKLQDGINHNPDFICRGEYTM